MEDAEALVVPCELTLALQDVDLNRGLVVRSSREDLALVGGDGGVALDDLGADAAQSLNAQAQRGNVEQQLLNRHDRHYIYPSSTYVLLDYPHF